MHPFLSPGDPLPRWQMQASWIRALKRLGHEVRVVKYTPDDRIRLGWGERIKWNLRVVRRVWEVGEADLIIYSLGADALLPRTIHYIKVKTGAPLVVLSGVSPIKQGNRRERAMAKYVDLAAVNDQSHADEWLKLGAKRALVLPIAGVDPELHRERRIRGIKGRTFEVYLKDIDVLFIGTLTQERKKFFEKLRRLLPDKISMAVKEFVWEEEYAELMSRAKIGVNLLRPEMEHGVNLRAFEIPAFGAMEITNFTRPEWLVPGKEAEVFNSVEEAAKLVKKYLKDDETRREVAAAGRDRVIREHTFDDRAKRLMEMVSVEFDKARPSVTKAGPLIDVSVCVVNYRADKELRRCLDSIKEFTKGVSYETIVIDNSTDNRWYSGGNNLAASRAKGKYLFFVNPDVYFEDDAISGLVRWMDKHPQAAAAEPRQAYESGEAAPTGSLLPKWWIDAVEMTGLSRVFGSVGRRGIIRELGVFREFRQSDKDRKKNWRTEAVSGAAMMVRREIFDKIGGFDESLKLYYADVDLCRRIKRSGWEIWHAGEISVRHTTRASTSKLPWDRLNLIYAVDGREYYRKWGEGIQGDVLRRMMIMNRQMVKFFGSNKVRPSDGRSDLSAVMIASDGEDEKKLKTAIESVGFADEVLVEKIAAPIKDFSKARNGALKKARGEWVLFIDSDEEITPALAGEIQKRSLLALQQGDSLNDINGFYFRRTDRFLGKWLKHGETASVRLLRLERKGSGKWERPVHEVWKIGGRVGELKNPILHYSHESVDEMVEKLDRYSGIEAEYRLRRLGGLGKFGKLGILGEMAIFPAGKFFWNYFSRLGFLDGIEGFIHALVMSGHSFLVRAKLLERYECRK